MNAINDTQLRAVTHYDVDRRACEMAVEAISEVVAHPAPVAVMAP